MIKDNIFFELLQVAVGNRAELTVRLSDKQWASLYKVFKKQTLLGIGFCGISRLPKEQRPPMVQFAQWIYDAENLKDKNIRISKECAALYKQLTDDGIDACIIKGQSNYAYYDEFLRDYRTPGDIDVLMRPMTDYSGQKGVRGTIEYCIAQCKKHNKPVGKICYHHMDMPWKGKTEVEAHHRATWMNSYIRNRRLQSWLERNMPFKEKIQVGDSVFGVASVEYNTVYQLLHIYKHLFEEGIGLRQILDYYFVLQALDKAPDSEQKKKEIVRLFKCFGMSRFVEAMMYVQQKVFAMPDDYLLCQPNEKQGEFLLSEILKAGNFGRYDQRIDHTGGRTKHAWEKSKHNLRLLTHYPEEVMHEPFFRLYHWVWRRFELWKR